jgi:hypothetical protein
VVINSLKAKVKDGVLNHIKQRKSEEAESEIERFCNDEINWKNTKVETGYTVSIRANKGAVLALSLAGKGATVGVLGGAIAGVAAGAGAGAVVGGSICSIGGPMGSVVGAALGAVIGGPVGKAIGRARRRVSGEKAESKMKLELTAEEIFRCLPPESCISSDTQTIEAKIPVKADSETLTKY